MRRVRRLHKKKRSKIDLCIFSGNQHFQQLKPEDEELFEVRNFGWLNPYETGLYVYFQATKKDF